MTQNDEPLIKVHKKDIRERFRESSLPLEKELVKSDIRRKRPIRMIDVKKATQPTELLQTMRSQYILGKLGSKIQTKLEEIPIERKDMFTTCQLGYDGMKYNKRLVEERMKAIERADKPSMLTYQRLLPPLGNYIIGYKVLKKYCEEFIKTQQLQKAEEYYQRTKQEVEAIDDALIDIPKVYPHHLSRRRRRHGIIPPLKKKQAPVLYNVDGRPIKYLDLFDIDELIAEYEATHWGKSAIWRGAKTKAFKEWMESL